MKTYIVYCKTNDSGFITAVNSSAFLEDTSGWTEIDRGIGDKYHHAQGNYFSKSYRTPSGVWQYKLIDGKPQECTPGETKEQEDANKPEPIPSPEERIKVLEEELAAAKLVLGVK